MALVKCPDCGHDVSDLAPACVNCGRPIASAAEPPEVCEVVLRRVHGLGLLGGARWVLEGQVMSPTGIRLVASCEYSSDNELANFQGSEREFHTAREAITNQLLRAGWESLASMPGGDGISLPRFQRPAGREREERERLLKGAPGSAKSGVLLTRVFQRGCNNVTYGVLVDGVNVVPKLANGASTCIELPPGRHTIQISRAFTKSNSLELDTEPDEVIDLACGFAGVFKWGIKMGIGVAIRFSEDSRLPISDGRGPFYP